MRPLYEFTTFTLVLLCLVSCQRVSGSEKTTAAEPQPVQSTTSAPRRLTVLSFAAFDHDDLIECDDLDIPEPKPGTDLKSGADQFWAAFNKNKGSKVITRLQRPCAEQFSDRPAFGTCADMIVVKDAPALRGRIGHYSFADVFRSDWAMRECLENGGRWSSLPRDSSGFREAQLRFDTIQMQRKMDKLMKNTDN